MTQPFIVYSLPDNKKALHVNARAAMRLCPVASSAPLHQQYTTVGKHIHTFCLAYLSPFFISINCKNVSAHLPLCQVADIQNMVNLSATQRPSRSPHPLRTGRKPLRFPPSAANLPMPMISSLFCVLFRFFESSFFWFHIRQHQDMTMQHFFALQKCWRQLAVKKNFFVILSHNMHKCSKIQHCAFRKQVYQVFFKAGALHGFLTATLSSLKIIHCKRHSVTHMIPTFLFCPCIVLIYPSLFPLSIDFIS